MKNLILYLLILLAPASLLAQDRETRSTSFSSTNAGFSTISEAAKIAEEIVRVSGVKANFLIAEADVTNAVAILQQGKRYILYNPKFMSAITFATGTKWAAISVLAHEIGHHLFAGNRSGGTPTLATELEADEFSGYVLEKMGATLAEAQVAMGFLGSSRASKSHPARADRVRSIAKGYKNAGGVVPEEEQVTAVISNKRQQLETGKADITAMIHFNANPTAKFIVTKELTVMRLGGAQAVTIGRVAKSDSEQFPFVIYDDTGYSLYVHHSGAILNKSGTIVGRMKAVAPDS